MSFAVNLCLVLQILFSKSKLASDTNYQPINKQISVSHQRNMLQSSPKTAGTGSRSAFPPPPSPKWQARPGKVGEARSVAAWNSSLGARKEERGVVARS